MDALRPLGIAALEDKIVQSALVSVLNAVYEEDFLGFSYGFRLGQRPTRCAGCLRSECGSCEGELVVDADIERFFDTVDHDWLLRSVAHRIGDPGHEADPAMAARRCHGRWIGQRETLEGTLQGGDLATVGEHLSALCV
ncbi:MAG: group II intron reverse transcriptase domain-containing protein [Xanthomonadales bacterium]|nr:group II intron reverse transcriptase domain-containing protein [Xanthomonadales bacterium]